MTAIAIFVKTPGLSPVKTRLAADWGSANAQRWHQLAAACVAASARQADIGPVYWAVAEPEALGHSLWAGLPALQQGSGGLGQRMHSILDWLVEQHGSGLLLGADAPQWNPDWLRQAATWLHNDQDRLCIGPAHDGGFWAFGANRPLAGASWTSVAYSQPDTARQFREVMSAYGEWLTLPTLTDLDQLGDLRNVLQELVSLGAQHAAHRLLMQWLETVHTV